MKLNTRNLMIFPSVLAVTLMLSACGTAVSANDATPSPVVTTAAIQVTEAFGIVDSTRILNVSIPLQADIGELNIRDGQRVNQGDALAVLDMTDSEYQIARKEEEIAALKLDILHTESQGSGKQADLARSQNDLSNAGRILADDERELARKEELLKQGVVIQKEVDDQKEKVASQKKTVRDAELAVSGAKDSSGLSSSDRNNQVAQKKSQLKQLEAELDHLVKNTESPSLQAGVLHSPMKDAVVTDVTVRAGDRVAAGQKLFTLKDLDALIVTADISEEFVRDVRPGMTVEVTPIADKSRTYAGKITRISGTAVNKNGQTIVPAEITLDKPDDFILPGFNVNVSIPADQTEGE